jgi:ADP-heptose:LPS heptosyltransferase
LLRNRYPNASIALLVDERFYEIAAYFPYVNEVIDGQHRLWGFSPDYDERNVNFDIILTFLISADVQTKARLFYKINREQKKINP